MVGRSVHLANPQPEHINTVAKRVIMLDVTPVIDSPNIDRVAQTRISDFRLCHHLKLQSGLNGLHNPQRADDTILVKSISPVRPAVMGPSDTGNLMMSGLSSCGAHRVYRMPILKYFDHFCWIYMAFTIQTHKKLRLAVMPLKNIHIVGHRHTLGIPVKQIVIPRIEADQG